MPNVFGSISTPGSCSSTAEPIGCFFHNLSRSKSKPPRKQNSFLSFLKTRAQNQEPQLDLAFKPLTPPPLVLSYGAGVDSIAMLVGLAQRAIRPDLILFADTGSERDETYDYLPIIESWLAKTDFPEVTRVRYHVQHGRFGAYRSLTENCLYNGTLPSLAFGRKAC